MPIELDKGHDEPIFGSEGKPNMAERFRLAREIGGRARRLAASAQLRMTARRLTRRGRRGRLA